MSVESTAVARRRPGLPQRIGLRLLAGALALLVLAGPLYRVGAVPLRPALLALALAALLVIAAFALLLVGTLAPASQSPRHSPAPAIAALLIAGVLLVNFGFWAQRAFGVPPIHDVSTDLDDPPRFVAVVALREQSGAVNPPEYVAEAQGRDGVIGVPDAQRKRYPNIQPARLDVTPAVAFARAERAARTMGWDIVTSVPGEGRIEATDTTFYFGFKDDIVIRVRPDGADSRIDVRSTSRVGMSDVGTNAARIHDYLDALAEQQ